jgi:hypothetical protein
MIGPPATRQYLNDASIRTAAWTVLLPIRTAAPIRAAALSPCSAFAPTG